MDMTFKIVGYGKPGTSIVFIGARACIAILDVDGE
jgi:hypothetical protein